MHIDYIDAASECELAMSVRLDQVHALASRPATPRLGLWIAALALLLVCGFALAVLLGSRSSNLSSLAFWGTALFGPLLIWCAMAFVRGAMFFSQQSVADGWDEARQQDLIQRLRCGRRSQQVLGVSLYTGLREVGTPAQAQLDALLDGQVALKSQSSRSGGVARHSGLAGEIGESTEVVLTRVLTQVLADLVPTFANLPADRPIALLLCVEAELSDEALRQTWLEAWSASGIRQPVLAADGKGLAVVDHWLDHRVRDPALLMVIAAQIATSEFEGVAESAVGLLFGNWLTQSTVPPIACLHRPEQEREPDAEHLLRAVRQALDWVPLEAKSIERIWQAGVSAQRDADIASIMPQIPMTHIRDQALCNLNALLGHPGEVSPWLAIAAASLAIQRGASAQLIFSGDRSEGAGLWCTVLAPASPLSRQEI
jgi:hypothetical protein